MTTKSIPEGECGAGAPVSHDHGREPIIGAFSAAASFLIWGLSPVYWKVLKAVPPIEIIMHRMIWSFIFLVILLAIRGQAGSIRAALHNRRSLLMLLTTTMILGSNWYIFIWAVNTDRVLQASLGYYINPLLNVFLGMIFLRERLRPLQAVSVFMAGAAVLYMTIRVGEFPWIALSLALLFGFYGLIRKVAPVGSHEGLTIETFLLSIPAVFFLVYLDGNGAGSFLRVNLKTDLFLAGSAMVTALPLLLFTIGARRLRLTTVGFLQYIAPSCQFLLAVFLFREPISAAQVWTFLLIWSALAVFSTDSVINRDRKRPCTPPS